MSQGGSDAAVVTADTSKQDSKTRGTNQICIIIGDMVKDGHNVEATKEFLKHGYNVIILYSNIDETNEKEIGSWFDNKFAKQILEIGTIDVKSSENISKVFSGLASKLANDDWSQFEVTVLIYNAALGLVKLAGKEDEKKDENEKSGLTFEELSHCHSIGGHGFIHSVKEGLKFIDKESKCNFHIFYGKPSFDDNNNGELCKVLNKISNYGETLVKDPISKNDKIFLHSKRIEKNGDARMYWHCIKDDDDIGDSYLGWATYTKTCTISISIDGTTYYLSTSNVNSNNSITLSTTSSTWTIGTVYSILYCIGATNGETKALTINGSSSKYTVTANSSSVTANEKWNLRPAISSDVSFADGFKIVNSGRNRALTYTSSTVNGVTVYTATSTDDKKTNTNTIWTIS